MTSKWEYIYIYIYILQGQGYSLQGNIYSSVGEVMLQCKIMLQAIFGATCFYVDQWNEFLWVMVVY